MNLGQAAEISALHLLPLTTLKMINIPKIILLAEVDVPIRWKLIFEKVLKILKKKSVKYAPFSIVDLSFKKI